MNTIQSPSVNQKIKPFKYAFCKLSVAIAPLLLAVSAHSQEEPSSNKSVSESAYFCSLSEAVEAIHGSRTFSEIEDYRGPPFKAEFPVTEEREYLAAEGYTEGNQQYWYIKIKPTAVGTYSIHGVFDFEDKTLSTSRSVIFELQTGDVAPMATSFFYLCELDQ